MGRGLLLTVGDSHWAVPLEQACEVLVSPPVTPIPSSPAALVGICHLRGELLPVVSLTALRGAGRAGGEERGAAWMVVVGAAAGRAAIAVTEVPTVVEDTAGVARLDVEEVLTPARIAGPPEGGFVADREPSTDFVTDAGVRLEAVAAGLRRLETGLDPDLLAALAGEAHALTEGSAAAALDDVSGVAHAMEELLGDLQAGTRPASAALVGALLRTATDLGAVIETVPAGGERGEALAALRAGLEPFSGLSPGLSEGLSPASAAESVGARCQKLTPSANAHTGPPAETVAPGPPPLLRCLLFEAGGRPYALPMPSVAVLATGAEPGPVWSGGRPVVVVDLQRVLGAAAPAGPAGPVVVVNGRDRSHGFRVDALVGPRDVVVHPLPPLAGHNPLVAGVSIEPDGSALCVLDGAGLVERAGRPDPAE